MSLEAKLHTIGIPLRLVKLRPAQEMINTFKNIIKNSWVDNKSPRVMLVKEYNPKAEEIIVAVAIASVELNAKCFVLLNPLLPDMSNSGCVYIIPAYSNQYDQILKKLIFSNIALVIGASILPIAKDFIVEV